MIGLSSMQGKLVGEWKSGPQSISLYHSNNHFLARIQDQTDAQTEIDSAHIKCGILGKIPHDLLIQKIVQLVREKIQDHIAVCYYQPQGQPKEVWVFEAVHGAALWIKKAKENLKQGDSEKEEKAFDYYQKALKHLETALKIQGNQKGNTEELNSAILQLKKELLLRQIKRDFPLYLSAEQEREANEVIELYKGEDLFSGLSDYLKAFEESAALSPYYLFLSALLDEHSNRTASAIQNYLHLAEHHSDPLPCFKKAEELVKQIGVSDPFALPHFLEKIDRNKLSQLRQTTRYLGDLNRLLLQKDALRMTFEKCLATLNQHSPQEKAPTCFICFNGEEADVEGWLERVLVPDLDRMGIQPLFCLRDLNPGRGELNNFQSLIREADQVMIVCTPDLKRKCEERKKNPTGVAQEIRLARQRYNDIDKYETNFILYLKGDQKISCPDVFFEPILGTTLTCLDKSQESSIFSYYASTFELFGGMRNIPRTVSRQVKEDFLLEAKKVFDGEVDQKELEAWRQARQSQIECVLKAAQERIIKMTKMVHLPLPPKDFTGRQQELQDLHTACQHQQRVAITGLGGVGKTALALKYAHDHQTDYQFIYLIPAGTSQLIRNGLLQLADELHLPKVERIEERLELLKRRLDQFDLKYLLIFDGIDQIEAFDEFTKYLPDRGNCLLLTSRMPEQSRIREFELIKLQPFSIEEAVNYLLQVTGSDEKEKASELAERLGRLPLALKHAAGYIRSRGISIHEYIQEFDRFQLKLFEDERLSLLTKEEKTILTTWNISLNAIEIVHKCPLAKEVIAFFAFLSQAPIPLDLIKDWFKTSHPSSEELDLGEALRHLLGYSMIDGSSDFYQIHPLVQQVTHHQMIDPQKMFEQAFVTLTLQLRRFQEDDVNTWNPTKPVVPHALSLFKRHGLIENLLLENQHEFMILLGNICQTHGNFYQALEVEQSSLKVAKQWREDHPQLKETSLALALSYHNIGACLENLGKHEEALKYKQKALEIRLKLYGEEHPHVAIIHNNIGLSLERLGKHAEALIRHQMALKIWQKEYGEEHQHVATSYNNIGLSLYSQGKYEEALNYHQKALRIWLKLYKESYQVAKSYHNIGLNLERLGKHEEALNYHQKALNIWLKVYGAEHPDVALSYGNIGTNLQNLGKFDKALEYHQKALMIFLKVFREEHPYIALSYGNIGSSLQSLGKLDEVLEYHQKALNICLKLYGEEHQKVALCYGNIGFCLKSLGKYKEALEYHQKALRITLKMYGAEHPDVGMYCDNIGQCLESLGKYDEALECLQKALKIWIGVHGKASPIVAVTYNNIGSSLQSLGKYNEALEYHQKTLKIWLSEYGEEHPQVATSYNNIGVDLQDLGKYDEALKYQRKALKILLNVCEEQHPQVATTYNNIGLSLNSLGKPNEALEYYQKALNIWLKVHREGHSDIGMCYNNIGLSLESLKKHEEALKHHQKALNIWLKICGEGHPHVGMCYNNIGLNLESMGKLDEALENYQKALKIRLKVHLEDHPLVAVIYNNIGHCLASQGKSYDAIEYYQKALKIRLKLHQEDHPLVGICYNNIGVILMSLRKYDEVLEYLQKSLRIWLKMYGKEHPDVAIIYDNIGHSLESLGRYEEALDYYQKVLQIYESANPSNPIELAKAKQNLTKILNLIKCQQEVKNQSKLKDILSRYSVDTKEQALRRAAWDGNIEVMEYLIRKEKVDINSQDQNKMYTPLHWAVIMKHKDAILWLIEQGAKVDITDARGKSPKDHDQAGLMNK